jgi:hypothetical protein
LENVHVAPTRNSSRAQQRQIDLTTAVCQERLLATHVRHVIAMVDLVSDRLPFDDALDIYVRILNLTPEQARNIGSRALAMIGRRSGLPEVDSFEIDETEEEISREEAARAESGGRSEAVFGRLRRRIRGRVHDDLRNRINLAAARAEDHLFGTHVDNSLIFAKALADDMTIPEAVEQYLEIMAIPDGRADAVYNRALRMVADDLLPPVSRGVEPRPSAGEAATPVRADAELH